MKNRNIIEQYMHSLEDELMMYKDSISHNSLPYIKNLKEMYDCFEKELEHSEIPKEEYHMKNKSDEKNILDEYNNYLYYHNEYSKTGDKSNLDQAKMELGHFLSFLSDMFEEISEHTKEDMEEKSMIKAVIKNIYTNIG